MRFVRPVPIKTSPRVSVVVPCYNYGRYLPQLVASLLDQPGVDVDVLIVDDASPDGSGDVADRLADAAPAVSVVRHTTNQGHIKTYNDGLAAVSGDFVVLLSADDLIPPGALSRSVALMEQYPEVGMVYGYARSFAGEPPLVNSRVRNWSLWKGGEWLGLSARKGRSFISSPEVVMRTAALRQVGPYDPRLPHSGDLDLWLRTSLHWDVGRINGPTQALYRVHEANMHLTTYAGMITDLRARQQTFSLLFDEHALLRPEVQSLRAPAMRALAHESLRRALIAHRDQDPPELIQQYLSFALETDPSVSSSLWWRLCQAGPLSGRSFPAVAPRRFASKVRNHLWWLRERRYGT